MREPTEDEIHIESQLLYLFKNTYKNDMDWNTDLVKEFIDVDEWELAADSMAFEYLPGKLPLTESIYKIFVDLDKRMNLQEKDWCHGIKELLSNPPYA